jgi:Dolichyl-phosphate-mannose-protein mannosyltransferase
MESRDLVLRATVVVGAAVWAITETLSVFGAVRRIPLAIAWIAVFTAGSALAWRRGRFTGIRMCRIDWIVAAYGAACAVVLTLTAVTAAFSPPNSADAMAYHMPRILYWAEQGSVRFFPTQYLNQIMLQPFAEYCMLQSYVLSGSDHFINFVQWIAAALCVIAVSAIAREFGAPPRAQVFAALFCAAIPSGILASSGAKNDYVLALCLAAAVYFALRWRRSCAGEDAALLGCALGLALLTKATAYLFAPWPLVAILARPALESGRRFARAAVLMAACALAINVPQYIRNWDLSGSPMGYGSAFGTGEFRWRNETLGWKQTISNALRNTSEQLGARSEASNRGVYDAVIAVHRRLGIDPADPATTWKWSAYAPPRNANHEADAPNRVPLAILAALFGVLLWRAARGRDRLLALYALSLVVGFVAFCGYLKWQPFMARLFLPLFVLGAPLASMVRPLWLQAALCLLLLDGARRPALENWVRPLRGPRSVFAVPREQQYFSDMVQWREDWPAYWATVDELKKSNCNVVGIDSSHFQLEYPLEALLREAEPGGLFVHAGVRNASARYRQPVEETPCAVVCLHCEGGDWRAGSFTVTYRK